MWWIILVIVAIIILGLGVGLLADAPGRKEALELTYSKINFNSFGDGTYIGEYQGTKSHMRDTKVEVKIDDGTISDVKILKGAIDKNGEPVILSNNRSIKDVFQNVTSLRTLEVDVISGATITTKTHLKALEQALKKAEKQR